MSSEKIDFSALDPLRDPERFDRLVDEIAGRGLAAYRRSQTFSGQIVRWARPALAAAAVLVVSVWVGTLVADRLAQPAPSRTKDDTASFMSWALGETGGSVWEDLELAGGRDGAW